MEEIYGGTHHKANVYHAFLQMSRKKGLIAKKKRKTKTRIELFGSRTLESVVVVTRRDGMFWGKVKIWVTRSKGTIPRNLNKFGPAIEEKKHADGQMNEHDGILFLFADMQIYKTQ